MIFIPVVSCITLIVPKNHLNHRLTYSDGPKIINSSVNEATRVDDYFFLSDHLTYLKNSENSLCLKNNTELYVCPVSEKSVVWKIQDQRREVKFKDAYGECITVGKHNIRDDSYDVEIKTCSDNNDDQIFILSKEHGNGIFPVINGKNVNDISESEKELFKGKHFKYK